MPAYLRGEKRDVLTYVRLGLATSNFFYGFNTKDLDGGANVSQADLIAIGHTAAANLPAGAIYYLRAQSPKPGRVRKQINANPGVAQKGSVSTFYGAGSITTALAAGWKIVKRPRGVSLSNNARYVTAIAKLSNGVLYCFPMNKADFDTYQADLGLMSPASITTPAERLKLVQASSFPRPGRVSLALADGSDFSSFFSTDQYDSLITKNYKIIEQELNFAEA